MTAGAASTILPETTLENLEHVPLLVSGACYMVGTAIYVAVCAWLLMIYLRGGMQEPLRSVIIRWVIRAFIVAVISSVAIVVYYGRIAAHGWRVLTPEAVFFCVLMLWYGLLRWRTGMDFRTIIFNLVFFEPVKVTGVFILCLGVWSVSLLSGQGALDFTRTFSPALDGLSSLFVITFWTSLLLFLFFAAWQKLKELDVDEEPALWLGDVLWPVLIAIGIMMIPLYLEISLDKPNLHEAARQQLPLGKV